MLEYGSMLFLWKGRPTGILSSVSCRALGFVVGKCILLEIQNLCAMSTLATDVFRQLRSAFVFGVRNISHLTFRGPCIVSIFLLICFQQDATLHRSFISGKLLYIFRVESTLIIRSTQLYLQYPVLVKPLLLPAAIVDELELVWVWCGNCMRFHPKNVEQFSRNKSSV